MLHVLLRVVTCGLLHVWIRFVDDSSAIINENAITSFHDTLNSINSHIKFATEHEKDKEIAFLDMLISKRTNRKPTHTDRHVDYTAHHDMKHKISTAITLINGSLNLHTTEDSKSTVLQHVSAALTSNDTRKHRYYQSN